MVRKKRKFKNILIIVLLISIVSLSLAYASFSQRLEVSGTAKVLSNGNWNIAFDKIESRDTTGYATATASKSETEKTLSFRCEFIAESDSCTIKTSLINKGNISAVYKGLEYTILENSESTTTSPTYDGDALHFEDETIILDINNDFQEEQIFNPNDKGNIVVEAKLRNNALIDAQLDRYTITLTYKFEQVTKE